MCRDFLMLRTIAVALLAFGTTDAVPAQEPEEPVQATVVANKEYFVRQQPGEVIVVRVDAFEAAFTSELTTEDGEVAARSGLAQARMLPIYQFVPEAAAPRQIDIEVSATQVTDRTEFELVTTRLNVRDERSANLATAYRLLANGLEVLPGGNIPAWTVKIQTLMQSGREFEDLGMREQGLLCSVYASHLLLYEMRDAQTALDWAEEILAVPQVERYEEIFFAARKLRSAAMAAGAAAAPSDPANSPLQAALTDTVESARALGFRYEEAQALKTAGVDLKRHGLHQAALKRLEAALQVAEEIRASDLATAIREHIVEIHGEAGNSEASGNVLQDIELQLLEAGEDEELARNLLQQGQLYLESHRYTEAVEVLNRATRLEQSSLTRLRSELALGEAFHGAGRSREALAHLERAATHPGTGDFRQPSAVLNLFAALGAIADIYRQLGEFGQMDLVRQAQGEHARDESERARWSYARAVDALVQSGGGGAETRERFESAYRRSGSGGARVWRGLARLRLCALPSLAGGDDQRCTAFATRGAFETAQTIGEPSQQAEASLVYAHLLGLRGHAAHALEVAEARIDSLLRSGSAVLGAWYWEWRAELFDTYMEMAIRQEGSRGDDAAASLLALARARAVDRGPDGRTPPVSRAGLGAFLDGLPPDSMVLTYYLGQRTAHAWLADGDRVRRLDIPGAARIDSLCRETRAAIQAGAWDRFERASDRLGAALLEPLSAELARSLYILSQGALAGIPMDALTLNGAPLGTRHEVLHLDHFPPTPGSAQRLDIPTPGRVFLAGNPRDWSGEYATRLEVSAEMESVIEHFVGPGLNTVQGVALQADEFTDSRYADAELAHLSIPGVIELAPPRESRLFLSETARGEGRQGLDAAELGLIPSNAGLVFFSRTEVIGAGAAMDNRLGVVSAVLGAGAGAAIATLWPVTDESRSRFVSGFYDHLMNDRNAATALTRVKRDSMQRGDTFDWASFQLFLN